MDRQARRCKEALLDGVHRQALESRFGTKLVKEVLATLTEAERAHRHELVTEQLPEDRRHLEANRRRYRARKAARAKSSS